MKQENRELLIKYGISFGIASLISFFIISYKGFFTDSIAVNIQILSDAFSVSGMLFLFFAGMMYISGEGIFIGVGYVLRNVVQAFIPMGRRNHEVYAKYRERKLAKTKRASADRCILVTGLVFFLIGITLTVIWYKNFYNAAI